MFNNKKIVSVLVVILVFCLGSILLIGCGRQGTTSSSSTTSTISGKLYSGTITSSSVLAASVSGQASASSPQANKTIVAVNKSTGKIYFSGKTDSDGSYSISAPSGDYMLSVIDENNKFQAALGLSTSGSKVVMGLDTSSDVDLGQVVIDTDKSAAYPVTSPASSQLDTTLLA